MGSKLTRILAAALTVGCGPSVLADGVDEAGGGSSSSAEPVDSGATGPSTNTGPSTSTGGPPGGSTSSSSTSGPPGDAEGSTTEVAPPIAGLVGAAFYEDGLCPWNYDYQSYEPPRLTLQISGASLVCNMIMWNALIEDGEYPTWFAELHFPFDQPGVYDLAEVGGLMWLNVIDADTSGGAAGGPLAQGIVEISYVDATVVIGSLSGLVQGNLNGVDYELNGSFEAIRCSQAGWLDVHPGEPHEPPLPRGCLEP